MGLVFGELELMKLSDRTVIVYFSFLVFMAIFPPDANCQEIEEFSPQGFAYHWRSKESGNCEMILIAQDSEGQIGSDGEPQSSGASDVSETVNNSMDGESGSKRVNNLANLEALLNIIAFFVEIGFLFLAFVIFCVSWYLILAKKKVAWGVGLIILSLSFAVFGLSITGILNWLIASARDANLFS